MKTQNLTAILPNPAAIKPEPFHKPHALKVIRSRHYKSVHDGTVWQFDPHDHTLQRVVWGAITSDCEWTKIPLSPPELVEVIYNPFVETFELTPGASGYLALNVYQAPLWRRESYFLGIPIERVNDCPQIYLDLLNHVFDGHQESINWHLNWIACLLKSKQPTWSCLVGAQRGIGKGTLAGVIESLVGRDNAVRLKQAFLTKEFNGSVRFAQFAFLDEVSIDDEATFSAAKMYTNNRIGIERKGVDAETIDLHASMMLANNDAESLCGVQREGDRQFSVPMLTNKPLRIPRTQHAELLSPENIAKLGAYLWHFPCDFELASQPLKTEHYDIVVKASKREWQAVIEEDLQGKLGTGLASPANLLAKLKDSCGRYTPNRDTILGFMKQLGHLYHPFEKKAGSATKRFILVRGADESDEGWAARVEAAKSLTAAELLKLVDRPSLPLFSGGAQ